MKNENDPEMTPADLALALRVTERTVRRWFERGCPHDEETGRANVDEVRAWCAQNDVRLLPELPDAPAAALEAGPPPGPTVRATAANVDLLRKLTQAKKGELELQAARGLRSLGLEEKIQAAKTPADLLEYTKLVIGLVASGVMPTDRSNALERHLTAAARHMKAVQAAEGGAEDQPILLASPHGVRLLDLFEWIVSDERRMRILEHVARERAEDEAEHPNVDMAADVPHDTGPMPDEEEAA